MTYADTGVDYDLMDPFKRSAQRAALRTSDNIKRFGMEVVEWTRGESVFLVRDGGRYIAHVEEGLGTKNLVADAMYQINPIVNRYDDIAQDTVAMIVNDMATLGAFPVSVAMHLAVGDSRWLADEYRVHQLTEGWRRACDLAGCAWGPGETPTLKNIVDPNAVVLAGSSWGVTLGRHVINPADICAGDKIIFLESRGIHANGLTLARDIAKKLAQIGGSDSTGFFTEVPNSGGRSYGDELLSPTHIYTYVVEECIREGVELHYAVNITGHGWRKLMRAKESFTYVIERLPRSRPIFDFIQAHGPVSDEEAYGNLNMGAGFALYMSSRNADRFLALAAKHNWPFDSFVAGHIEAGEKRVVIEPKGIEFKADTLQVR